MPQRVKIETAIAVVVAVVVAIVIFVYPGLWPLHPLSPSAQPSGMATSTEPSTATSTASSTNSDTTGQTSNHLPMNTSATDTLQITDDTVGTGAVAQAGDTVTVEYVGTLANGTIFDASARHTSTANGFTFMLGANPPQVITGWNEGVVGMKEGGTRTLVIPPALAYGTQGVPGVIPPNATLTFQIKLLKVTPPAH